jgi:hypothetical protein
MWQIAWWHADLAGLAVNEHLAAAMAFSRPVLSYDGIVASRLFAGIAFFARILGQLVRQ